MINMKDLRKMRFLIPNACTSFSLLMGLASVYCSIKGNYDLAAWMILWSVLLDKLDGTMARIFKATSEFGMQFDSFADFVAFGCAPAALYVLALSDPNFAAGALVNDKWMLAASGVYVVSVSVRLARFNIATPPMANNVFYGMPTTVMGAALSGWYLTWGKFDLSPELMSPMPFILLICAFAMISNVLLPKLKLRSNLSLNVFLVVNIIFSYVAAPMQILPEVLFSQAVVYMGVGSLWYFIYPPSPDNKEKEEELGELMEEEPEPIIAR
jgi:CDP-diacylglycerol--serine O-phosphatidyltransferase